MDARDTDAEEPEAAVIHTGIGILIAWGGLSPDEGQVVLHDVAARSGRTPRAVAELLRASAPSGSVDFRIWGALRAAIDECLAWAPADRPLPGPSAP